MKVHSQTVIPKTTTVAKLDSLPTGIYRFFNSKDTVDFSKDIPLVKTIHDTIIKVVPPVCPPPQKQRTAIGITWDIINNVKIITYDDGSKTSL